ncbi:hypothetical protein LSH36_58g03031 [Paralvinella palmiformis]|uniref:Ig-like domain-containing protein n=1 Tax=Paralvinella palmiformis TaxID=53620 RepID=A0AAD9K5A2_9ANNE|nr:hypothetical protein LSH36_58g03031 [Paralvinella palmiformis]
MPNRRISQERSKDTILECIITAFPHAMNYWEKDGRELTSSSGTTSGKYRVQPYDEGEHTITLSLRIHNIEATDYGEYRCVASNSLGTDTESMWLYEYKAPELDQYDNPKDVAPVNWLPTTRATEPKPSYDIGYNNKEKPRDWERTHNTPIGKSDKLSSSGMPLTRSSCYVIIIAVCTLLSTLDLHLLYRTML